MDVIDVRVRIGIVHFEKSLRQISVSRYKVNCAFCPGTSLRFADPFRNGKHMHSEGTITQIERVLIEICTFFHAHIGIIEYLVRHYCPETSGSEIRFETLDGIIKGSFRIHTIPIQISGIDSGIRIRKHIGRFTKLERFYSQFRWRCDIRLPIVTDMTYC